MDGYSNIHSELKAIKMFIFSCEFHYDALNLQSSDTLKKIGWINLNTIYNNNLSDEI